MVIVDAIDTLTFSIGFRDSAYTVYCFRNHTYSGSTRYTQEQAIECVKRLQSEGWVPETHMLPTQFDCTNWFLASMEV